MDANINSSANTGDPGGLPAAQNVEVNNLRNLEQNLIAAENRIIQNENQLQMRDNLAVTIEGMQLQSDNETHNEEDAYENEAESQQSRVMIEQALQAMHLYETKGFYVKYSGLPCCPSLKISPSIMGSGLFSVSPTSWAIKASSNNYGCFCCFMPASWSWQTITLTLGEQEVLNFIYRPQIWNCFGTKDRIVDIYVPQRNERIGLLKYKGNLDDGTIITDGISRSLFLAAKIADHPTPGFKITDNIGIPVAVAQASRGLRYRGITTWTDFELQYAPLAANMPASSKAILAVGFLMWVLTIREKNTRNRCAMVLVSILLGVLIAMITISLSN